MLTIGINSYRNYSISIKYLITMFKLNKYKSNLEFKVRLKYDV